MDTNEVPINIFIDLSKALDKNVANDKRHYWQEDIITAKQRIHNKWHSNTR